MSRSEKAICKRARCILKRMKSQRLSAQQLQQDPGFLNWLQRNAMQLGIRAGNMAIWVGNNAITAWNLYQLYQRVTTGTGSTPLPPIPSIPTNGQGFRSSLQAAPSMQPVRSFTPSPPPNGGTLSPPSTSNGGGSTERFQLPSGSGLQAPPRTTEPERATWTGVQMAYDGPLLRQTTKLI